MEISKDQNYAIHAGIVGVAVSECGCAECVFESTGCREAPCTPAERTDRRDVTFIKPTQE